MAFTCCVLPWLPIALAPWMSAAPGGAEPEGVVAAVSTPEAPTTATEPIPADLALPAGALVGPEDPWKWTVAVYAWMFGLNGTTSVRGLDANVDVAFSDLLDYLDFAAMGHVELWKGEWGFMFDGLYGKLSEQFGPDDSDIDVTQQLYELGLIRRVLVHDLDEQGERKLDLDVLVGGRYNGLHVHLDPGNPLLMTRNASESWIDLFVGARTRLDLSKRLELSVRADIGGFGIGDSSDPAWNAVGLLGYHVSPHWTVMGGYRIYDTDYESGSFEWDVQTAGAVVGLVYR
jgi:hypothetical protein